jgi:hypothetical protein
METKVIPKPLHKEPIEPSPRVLGSLINLIYSEVDTVNSYSELAELINQRFNVKVDEDMIVTFYGGYLQEVDATLIYSKYGYCKNEDYEKD